MTVVLFCVVGVVTVMMMIRVTDVEKAVLRVTDVDTGSATSHSITFCDLSLFIINYHISHWFMWWKFLKISFIHNPPHFALIPSIGFMVCFCDRICSLI